MIENKNTHIRWLLMFWMFVVSAIAYLDRVNISTAQLAIVREFHIDDAHLGWVFSAFVFGYALFQAPGGALADRIGPRRILAFGVVWWAVFTTLITLLSAKTGGLLALLIAIRFSLGLGEAVVYPASNCIVSSWIPSRERGVANGIIFAGVGFGAGMTPPLITYLVLNYGWRSCFWASALLGLFAGAIWWAIARDRPAQHPWISQQELTLIQQDLPGGRNTKHGGSKLPWRDILTNRNIWAISFSYFAYGYAAYIFFTWFIKYLSAERKLDIMHSSYYSMLPPLAMAIGSPLGGAISDWLTKRYGKRAGRCYWAAFAIAVSAVFLTMGTRADNVQIASVTLAAGAGALYLSQSSFWSVSADIGKSSAGSVSGFMNMCGQLGGTLTASLTPVIAHKFGWTASFAVAGSLCAAGALAWLPVKPDVDPARTATLVAEPVSGH